MFKLDRVEVLERKVSKFITFYLIDTDRYLYNSLSETLFKINSYRNICYKKVKKESVNKKTKFKKIFESDFNLYEPIFNLDYTSYDYNGLKYITDDFILINNFLHLVLFENCSNIEYEYPDVHETINTAIEIFSIDTKYQGYNYRYDSTHLKDKTYDNNESVLYSLNYYYDRSLFKYYHEYLTEIQLEKAFFVESFFMDIPYIKEFLLLNIESLSIEFLTLEDFNYKNITYAIKNFDKKKSSEELFLYCNNRIKDLRKKIVDDKLEEVNAVSNKDDVDISNLYITYSKNIHEIDEVKNDILGTNDTNMKIHNFIDNKTMCMNSEDKIDYINNLSNKFRYKRIFGHIDSNDKDEYSGNNIYDKIKEIQGIPQFISKLEGEDELKRIYNLINNEYPWFENVTQHIFKQLIIRLQGDQNICINPIIIQGDSGVGKTSYVNYITKLLKTPYYYYNTGGKSECLDFTGMSYSWKDSSPALIVNKIIENNIVNPFFAIDELDKYIVENSGNGGNLVHSLLEMIEPSTNDKFFDRFLSNNIDISKVNWIILINEKTSFNDVFLSRCDFVKADKPKITHFDKILENLYNKLANKFGLNKENIILNQTEYDKLKNNFKLNSNIRELRKEIENSLMNEEFNSFFNKKKAKLEVIK